MALLLVIRLVGGESCAGKIKFRKILRTWKGDKEVAQAARQYIGEISGYGKTSRVNQKVYERAMQEIGAATRRLLEDIGFVLGK